MPTINASHDILSHINGWRTCDTKSDQPTKYAADEYAIPQDTDQTIDQVVEGGNDQINATLDWKGLTVQDEVFLQPFFDESIVWISSCDAYLTDLVHRQSLASYTILEDLLLVRRWEEQGSSCGRWLLLPPLFRTLPDDSIARATVAQKIVEVMKTALLKMPGSCFDAISDKYLGLIHEHLTSQGLIVKLAEQAEWDYIYPCKELIALNSSTSLLEKRRRLRSFEKRYSPKVVPLAPESWSETLLQKCLTVAHGWVEENGAKVGCTEDNSECLRDHTFTLNLLNNFSRHANMRGVLVEVEGRPVALALVEVNSTGQIILSHVEKALLKAVPDGIRGVYPFTLCAYLKQLGQEDYEFVNREQDDGIPGLRTSKNLYKPIEWRRKWIAVLGNQ